MQVLDMQYQPATKSSCVNWHCYVYTLSLDMSTTCDSYGVFTSFPVMILKLLVRFGFVFNHHLLQKEVSLRA